MATWEDFKQCIRAQANLDLEAIDVMWIEPLKDLQKWWDRQSAPTKSFVNWFSVGLGGSSLVAFIAKVAGTTGAALSTAALDAMGAAIVGISLGLFITALADCGIQSVEIPSV